MSVAVPPALEGLRLRLRADVPLAARTTLRIGGPARLLAEVYDVAALAGVLRWAARDGTPLLMLGKGSNLLVADEGWDGVAVVLAGELLSVAVEGETLRAGGGASLAALSAAARDAGLSGLEGLSGIPSTFGGAVRINAGSYGSEVFDHLVEATVVTRAGDVRTVPAGAITHGYRWTALVESGEVVAAASLSLVRSPRDEIVARLAEVREKRRNALPVEPNAGSIFKNPPGDFAGRLLEECGLKGTREGGAEVSTRHANVIVNAGGATAADVRRLMARMQASVRERFGIALEPEIVVLPARASGGGPTQAGSSGTTGAGSGP